MTRDIGKYVEECDLCQRMKNRTEELAGKLKLSEVPKKPCVIRRKCGQTLARVRVSQT